MKRTGANDFIVGSTMLVAAVLLVSGTMWLGRWTWVSGVRAWKRASARTTRPPAASGRGNHAPPPA